MQLGEEIHPKIFFYGARILTTSGWHWKLEGRENSVQQSAFSPGLLATLNRNTFAEAEEYNTPNSNWVSTLLRKLF